MSAVNRDIWLAVNFAATIFVSAFLLFQVQPLVSKAILPWFGGTAAVWTTCMLFFQTVLFCGYAYAHLSDRWLVPKMQGLVHVGLIVVALLMLRIVPSDAWKPQDSSFPAFRILGLLAISVGLPYFVLSSTGPLLQAWFARTYPGKVPYRLYALSNFGSLLALLSYPFWFERCYNIPDQARYWSWGFVAYAVLCGYAAISIWLTFRDGAGQESGVRGQESDRAANAITSKQIAGSDSPPFSRDPQVALERPPTLIHRMLWIALPAFASVVLLATTNHVSIDVTPMPFLWVVPLALYLVTFIVAFDHPRWYWPTAFAIFTLLTVYLVGMAFYAGQSHLETKNYGVPGKLVHQIAKGVYEFEKWRGVPEEKLLDTDRIAIGFLTYAAMNFAALFGICMLCHGELVRIRPHPRYLTSFYLSIAAGGAIGGAAVSLIAPYVFVTYFEWNLSLWLGFLLAAGLVLRGIWWLSITCMRKLSWKPLLLMMPLLAIPFLIVVVMGTGDLWKYLRKSPDNIRFRTRNFFGTLAVQDENADNPDAHYFLLYHGRITHGLQFTDELRKQIPTTYYATASGVGRTVEYYHDSRKPEGIRIGAVGLGTGTMAAYVEKGDTIRFYEINPNVRRITEPGTWFTYLKDCRSRGGDYEIQMGDARLSLERELHEGQPQRFHVLVLDAFSGDAIPVHLLTQEAVETYLGHLATPENGGEYGALAVHITNRYLDLEPVVLGLAEHFHLGHVYIANANGDDEQYSSDWIILSKNENLLQELQPHAEPPPEIRKQPSEIRKPILWTDGRNNLIDVLN